MAPLSVFRPLPGNTTCRPVAANASRRARLAATPPDTTTVRRPVACAARTVVFTRVCTAARWKLAARFSGVAPARCARSAAVFRPLKLKSKPLWPFRGSLNGTAFGSPRVAASLMAGPPG